MKKLVQLTIMVTLAVTIVGCQTATQPGRANTQTTSVDDNSAITVDQSVHNMTSAIALPIMPLEGYSTNAFAQLKELLKFQQELNGKAASESRRTYGDVFTQNQMIENSGSEANNPTATSTPTTTTPIDVSWGGGGAASSLTAGTSAVKSLLSDGKASPITKVVGSDTACADGSCTKTQ